jgi:beta-phosphoglucomutase-like phosphatase (HAD superfamily)
LPGLSHFLEVAFNADIALAIGSAAIPFNIDFILDNLKIRHYFKAIVSADDVIHSKPDPQTFLRAAHMLNLDASACIVFEDAPKGVESALRAGMEAVVITTMHPKEDFQQYRNVLMCVEDYNDPRLMELLSVRNDSPVNHNPPV